MSEHHAEVTATPTVTNIVGTGQPSIVEFLEARITEDESILATTVVLLEHDGFDVTDDPHEARERREIEAKRRILERHVREAGPDGGCMTCDYDPDCGRTERNPDPCVTLCALAAIYVDHPDYQQAWAL